MLLASHALDTCIVAKLIWSSLHKRVDSLEGLDNFLGFVRLAQQVDDIPEVQQLPALTLQTCQQ